MNVREGFSKLNQLYSTRFDFGISSYLISGLVLVLFSWLHFFNTGSIIVDNNSIQPFWFNLVCSFLVAITVVILALNTYSLFKSPTEFSNQKLRTIFYPLVILSGAMLPLFSNDFFSFIGYADVSFQGCHVYSDPTCSNLSVFVDYINPIYRNVACKYGPFNLYIALFSFKLGGTSILNCYFWYKAVLVIFGFLYIEAALLIKQIKNVEINYKWILFNPIWWLQGVGQGHNDFFSIVFVLWAFYFLLKKWSILSIIAIVMAIFFKYTYIFLLILPVLYEIYVEKKWLSITIIKRGIQTLVIFIGIALLCYTPFVSQYSDIIDSFKVMSTGGPSSTFSDIASFIALSIHNNFEQNYTIIMPIFNAIGFLLLIILGFRYFYKERFMDIKELFRLLLQLFLVMVFVYSHRFLPWYLMIVPILISFVNTKEWSVYFIILFIFSTFQDISVMISTNEMIGQVLMVISTLIVVFFNFYKLRERFY